MRSGPEIFRRWLPLAALATLLCLVITLITQRTLRAMADDPQVMMAADAIALLQDGRSPESILASLPSVEISRSPEPFLIVLNGDGGVVAASGRWHGALRGLPAGVLDHVLWHGVEHVTWQPERGVRIAAVVAGWKRGRATPGDTSGFVVAGRSLADTQARLTLSKGLLALTWAALMLGLLVHASTESNRGNR